MSIYRRKYSVRLADGRSVQRQSPRYTIAVRDPATGRVRRFIGPADRKSAKAIEVDTIRKLERRHARVDDPYAEFRNEPFERTLDAFIAGLTTKGCDKKYVKTTRYRLQKISDDCNWGTIFDATRRSFESWRTRFAKRGFHGRPTKAKTLNQYLASANEFFDWCAGTERMEHNPLADVQRARVVENRDYRRDAKPDELKRFLSVLTDDMRRFYLFLTYSALRRKSLETLRWRGMHLEGNAPYVVVRGIHNKPRLEQRFPLRRDIAEMMLKARGDAKDDDLVFPHVPKMREHREFLERAEIEFSDEDGNRRLDLHAFRKTLMAMMEEAGVDVREASRALGHLHLSTTMRNYNPKRDADADRGVEKLPALSGGSLG